MSSAITSAETAVCVSTLALLYNSVQLFFTPDKMAAKAYGAGAVAPGDVTAECTHGALQWFGLTVAHRAAMIVTGWFTATSDTARATIAKCAGLCSLVTAAKMAAHMHKLHPSFSPMEPNNALLGMALAPALLCLYHGNAAKFPAFKFDFKDAHHVCAAAVVGFSVHHAYMFTFKGQESLEQFYVNERRTCSTHSVDAMGWFGMAMAQNAFVLLVVFFTNASQWQRAATFLTLFGNMASGIAFTQLRVHHDKMTADMTNTAISLVLAYGCFVLGWSIKPKSE